MGIQELDLEGLRSLFQDDRPLLELGMIEAVEVSLDRSVMRARVNIVPDNRLVIARISFGQTGPNAGFYLLPQKDDLVLVAYPARDPDHGIIIARLNSKDDTIPLRAALSNHFVASAKSGQEAHFTSDTKIVLDKGGLLPGSEPLVLGNVLKDAMTSMYDQQIAHLDKIITGPVGTGNLGNPVPTDPGLVINLTVIKTQLQMDKLQFVTTTLTNFLSQLAFTER